jgi:hypothetical protein
VGAAGRHGELMARSGPLVLHELTESQSHLVKRHERALLRLTDELAQRNGVEATAIMFVLADTNGRIGGAIRAAVRLRAIGPVVLPGRAEQLEAWVEHLARYAPVWDFQGKTDGLLVIVIDENDAVAVTRIERPPPR